MEDVYSKGGGVCSPDVLDENEVCVGSLDLAFGRTKKQGNKAKLRGFRPLVVKVTLVVVAGSNQIKPVQVSLILFKCT